MITLLEINEAINSKIISALAGTTFAAVPLLAEDLSEPIVRPSIKVAIENSENGKFNSKCREKNLTLRIYFFAKDRYQYKLDNAEMQDLLENMLLEDMEINGAYVPIKSVDSEVTDTVLVLSFDLYLLELMPYIDTSEPMEEIIFKGGN